MGGILEARLKLSCLALQVLYVGAQGAYVTTGIGGYRESVCAPRDAARQMDSRETQPMKLKKHTVDGKFKTVLLRVPKDLAESMLQDIADHQTELGAYFSMNEWILGAIHDKLKQGENYEL